MRQFPSYCVTEWILFPVTWPNNKHSQNMNIIIEIFVYISNLISVKVGNTALKQKTSLICIWVRAHLRLLIRQLSQNRPHSCYCIKRNACRQSISLNLILWKNYFFPGLPFSSLVPDYTAFSWWYFASPS